MNDHTEVNDKDRAAGQSRLNDGPVLTMIGICTW